jgi:hypothetical protein
MSNHDDAYPEDVLNRHRQWRIRDLKQALQDVYVWAYTDGKLSELDDLMARIGVPIPQEIVTRSRMARVWWEGCGRFPAERASGPSRDHSFEVTRMLHYTSLLGNRRIVDPEDARMWLWHTANTASKLLSEDFDVLTQALAEYSRAAQKHPDMTLECDGHTDATRLFALVEEIGEVAACLTYDNDTETGHGSDLESEVIQVIALALAWATRYLEDEEAGNE